MDFSTGFERGSSGAESRNTGQGDPGVHYSGGLFDLLMGEQCIPPRDFGRVRLMSQALVILVSDLP